MLRQYSSKQLLGWLMALLLATSCMPYSPCVGTVISLGRSCFMRSLRYGLRRSKIAEAEAAVSVNEKKWSVMHMHVQLKLDELRGPPNPWLTVT